MASNSIILWTSDLLKIVQLVSGRTQGPIYPLESPEYKLEILYVFTYLFMIFLPYQVKGSRAFKVLELFALEDHASYIFKVSQTLVQILY